MSTETAQQWLVLIRHGGVDIRPGARGLIKVRGRVTDELRAIIHARES